MVCDREMSLELRAMLVAVSSLSPVNIQTCVGYQGEISVQAKIFSYMVTRYYTLIPAFLSSSSVGRTLTCISKEYPNLKSKTS